MTLRVVLAERGVPLKVVEECPYCRLFHVASLIAGCAYDQARNEAEDAVDE